MNEIDNHPNRAQYFVNTFIWKHTRDERASEQKQIPEEKDATTTTTTAKRTNAHVNDGNEFESEA